MIDKLLGFTFFSRFTTQKNVKFTQKNKAKLFFHVKKQF